MVKQIEHNNGSATKIIQLNKAVEKGNYHLEIITPDDRKVSNKLLIE